MFPTKDVEAQSCDGICSIFDQSCGGGRCICRLDQFRFIPIGGCAVRTSTDVMEMGEEHPYLCESHDECNKKGIGSFCARSPNSEYKNGWCFASFSDAQEFFKFTTKYKFTRDFLKMPITT